VSRARPSDLRRTTRASMDSNSSLATQSVMIAPPASQRGKPMNPGRDGRGRSTTRTSNTTPASVFTAPGLNVQLLRSRRPKAGRRWADQDFSNAVSNKTPAGRTMTLRNELGFHLLKLTFGNLVGPDIERHKLMGRRSSSARRPPRRGRGHQHAPNARDIVRASNEYIVRPGRPRTRR